LNTKESTNDRILQAALDLILNGQAPLLSFELIAEQAGIASEQVAELYQDADEISLALTKIALKKHKEHATELSSQKGINALQNLMSHDLNFFYPLEMDRKIVAQNQYTESFALFAAYAEQEMPVIYSNFFTINRNLLPSTETDISYYGHFLAHSLLFFNTSHLAGFVKKDEDRKIITEQIIASLFGREQITLTNF
jgi:hypothetical protein